MSDRNYTLFVSSYADAGSAADDFEAIKSMDDAAVVAAVILSRDASGQTEVKEHGAAWSPAALRPAPSAGWWSDCSLRRSYCPA